MLAILLEQYVLLWFIRSSVVGLWSWGHTIDGCTINIDYWKCLFHIAEKLDVQSERERDSGKDDIDGGFLVSFWGFIYLSIHIMYGSLPVTSTNRVSLQV